MRIADFHRYIDFIRTRLQSHFFLLRCLFTVFIGITHGHFRLLRSRSDIIYCQLILNLRQFLSYRCLTHIIILNSCHIIINQMYGTPYTTGSQSNAPIPSITVRCFTGIDADTLVTMVIVCRIVESVCFPLR